jgi:excisionase family DNA binding protein
MGTNQHPVMTVDEVADYLRVPRASVYKLAQLGKIPGQKVGRHWRFRREAIENWLDAQVTQRRLVHQ